MLGGFWQKGGGTARQPVGLARRPDLLWAEGSETLYVASLHQSRGVCAIKFESGGHTRKLSAAVPPCMAYRLAKYGTFQEHPQKPWKPPGLEQFLSAIASLLLAFRALRTGRRESRRGRAEMRATRKSCRPWRASALPASCARLAEA